MAYTSQGRPVEEPAEMITRLAAGDWGTSGAERRRFCLSLHRLGLVGLHGRGAANHIGSAREVPQWRLDGFERILPLLSRLVREKSWPYVVGDEVAGDRPCSSGVDARPARWPEGRLRRAGEVLCRRLQSLGAMFAALDAPGSPWQASRADAGSQAIRRAAGSWMLVTTAAALHCRRPEWAEGATGGAVGPIFNGLVSGLPQKLADLPFEEIWERVETATDPTVRIALLGLACLRTVLLTADQLVGEGLCTSSEREALDALLPLGAG